jgi:hypothetical protein
LTHLAKPMGRLVVPRGFAVLSGLLPTHANAALAVYRSARFVLERRIMVEGWVTLVLARQAPSKTQTPRPRAGALSRTDPRPAISQRGVCRPRSRLRGIRPC